MRLYTVTLPGTTPNNADDLLTLVSPAGKTTVIKRIRASGEAGAATTMRTIISRSSAGATPSGAVTPNPCNSSDAAAATAVYGAWTTQPTLAAQPHYAEGWNAFGGGFDLTLDGREIYLANGDMLSVRNTVGTATMNLEIEFGEL